MKRPIKTPKKGKSQADKERDALETIAALLDRREWSADTLDAIAAICRRAGFTIRDTDAPKPLAEMDLDEIAEQQEWTDRTLLGLLREFISDAGMQDELDSFARETAAAEDAAAGRKR